MSKRPALRFKGYKKEWVQQKLGELVEIGDIDHRMPDTVADGIPYLMTGDFCGTNELNFSGVKTISESDYEQLSRKIKPEQGDIIFARYASVGAARFIDFSRRFLISYSCAIIKQSEKVNSKYLYHFITSIPAQKQIRLEVNAGTQANIGIDSMKNNIYVSLPSDGEQIKIADTLSKLDEVIILHQRKHDMLLTYKKAMLEKMFPKDGADVPEVRFAGFSSAWQLCTVGSVIEDCIEKTTVENQYPVLTSSQQHGILLQEDYFADRQITTENNIGYYVLPRGYFSYRSRSDTNLFVFNRNDVIDKGIISYYYPVFRAKNCDSDFLLVRLNYRMESQIAMAAEGTGQKVLAHTKFKKMCMYVPKLEEQIKIGSFFSKLEKRIICQRDYLVRLNAIKKSLLGKMFI